MTLVRELQNDLAHGEKDSGAPGGQFASTADLNTRVFVSVAQYLEHVTGRPALEAAVAEAGLTLEDFDGRTHWVSLAQAEAFLRAARNALRDDDEFLAASIYRYDDAGFAALKFMFRATTAWSGIVQVGRFMHLLTRIGRFEYERAGSLCRVRYSSTRVESELMCLVRRGQLMHVPTLWDLPPAKVEHSRCIARGDACCEYEFRLADRLRWLPIAAGVAVGALISFGAAHLGLPPVSWWAVGPLLGGLVGMAHEAWRLDRTSRVLAHESQAALIQITGDEAAARREVLAFQQRQQEWLVRVEEQLAERTNQLQGTLRELKAIEHERSQVLSALSHDLRNPLMVIQASADYLKSEHGEVDGQLLEDMEHASRSMADLLTHLMRVVRTDTVPSATTLVLQRLETAPMVERLRRRLNALTFGRDVRASTFATREAPTHIVTDELLLDRVIDNLLTNAVKYTARGSIVVELGGVPGYLVFKVSDTGRGISEAELERVFRPGGSERETRARDSYGLGLSVVVRLLGDVGGKLEVMSVPGSGTTIWAYFPVEARTGASESASDLTPEQHLRNVVTIRRALS